MCVTFNTFLEMICPIGHFGLIQFCGIVYGPMGMLEIALLTSCNTRARLVHVCGDTCHECLNMANTYRTLLLYFTQGVTVGQWWLGLLECSPAGMSFYFCPRTGTDVLRTFDMTGLHARSLLFRSTWSLILAFFLKLGRCRAVSFCMQHFLTLPYLTQPPLPKYQRSFKKTIFQWDIVNNKKTAPQCPRSQSYMQSKRHAHSLLWCPVSLSTVSS